MLRVTEGGVATGSPPLAATRITESGLLQSRANPQLASWSLDVTFASCLFLVCVFFFWFYSPSARWMMWLVDRSNPDSARNSSLLRSSSMSDSLMGIAGRPAPPAAIVDSSHKGRPHAHTQGPKDSFMVLG